MKRITSVYVDELLLSEAKKQGLDISAFLNNQLQLYLQDKIMLDSKIQEAIEKMIREEVNKFTANYHAYKQTLTYPQILSWITRRLKYEQLPVSPLKVAQEIEERLKEVYRGDHKL